MSKRTHWARTRAWTLAAGTSSAIVLVCAATPVSAADATAPSLSRSYTGNITAGTGAYRGASGAVRVTVASHLLKFAPRFADGSEYSIAITVRGASCAVGARRNRRPGCMVLSGTLAGTGVSEPGVPDLPGHLRLVATAGTIGPLGSVTATGRTSGTGYIKSGRRALFVTLAGARGTVSFGALGPPVAGFQAP